MSAYHKLFGIQAMNVTQLAADMSEYCAKQNELCSEFENKQSPLSQITAQMVLRAAADIIDIRAAERDRTDGERSMASTVRAFNALTGHALSETQGWLFMVLLKVARSQGGGYKPDDYEDMAAYAALAAECEHKTQHGETDEL